MNKAELRVIYKKKRKTLTLHQMDKWNDLLLINFQKIPLPFINCVHTFLPSLKLVETDTHAIVRYLKFLNPEMLVAVPKINFSENTMQNFRINDHTKLIENSYGIEEPDGGGLVTPEEIDLILIPLLAFDSKGFRVGYGKGFYDHFLSACRPDVIKIGLSFFEPVETIADLNVYDVAMDYCVTPQQVYEF